MSKSNKFFDKKVGGLNFERLTKTLDKGSGIHNLLAGNKKITAFDIPKNSKTFPFDIREPYETSDYITKFMTSTSGVDRRDTPVKEEFGMRTRLSELLEAIEDVDEAGEVEGDDDLGTPNFKADDSIVSGMDDLIDQGDDLDEDPQAEEINDEVMSDPEVKANAAKVIATEGVYTKDEYYFVLEEYISQICRLVLAEHFQNYQVDPYQVEFMANQLNESVLNDNLPAFAERLRDRELRPLLNLIVSIQEIATTFAQNPTKGYARELCERYMSIS